MNPPESEPSIPPPPPTEHPGVDRGDWGRVRIPGGQQGSPHTHPAGTPPASDESVEIDAYDDFDAYDETTSG